MSSITKDERELEVIKQWKELKITSVEFHFDCGGDSMGSTDFFVKTNEGDINAPDVVGYFEDVIYKNVEFYENSGGHYMGEAGVVDITLIEDEWEAPYFLYDKQSRSEWCENHSGIAKIVLTENEANFIREYVVGFNGGSDDSAVFRYSKDFIMSDEQQTLLDDIMEKVDEAADEIEIDVTEYDDFDMMDDNWYRYEFNNIDSENVLHVQVEKPFRIFKEE